MSFKTLDKGLIEQLGPTGLSALTFNTSFNITAIQTGFIYHIIFIFIYSFFIYFISFFLISSGISFAVYNLQFFTLIFGYLLLSLAKTN